MKAYKGFSIETGTDKGMEFQAFDKEGYLAFFASSLSELKSIIRNEVATYKTGYSLSNSSSILGL